MVSHTPFLLDDLFCEEEHYDNEESIIVNPEEQKEDTLNPDLFGQESVWDNEELTLLLNKEQENELYNAFGENPSLVRDRSEAVEWMLKVIEYYSFSALTAVLAVSYLDRFLFSFKSHRDKPWMSQLAAVACLSLAAKVEETQVPLLLDLQVEESKYVFESKTIQRMEILILSTRGWKMNPVTPFSFLDFIARRLALQNMEFLRRSESLILLIISDCRFMGFLPSTLATAIMLYVISSIEPSIGFEYQDQLVGILGINKDKVVECCRLIEEVSRNVHFNSNKRKFGSLPCSPKGVVDVSFTSESDISNDSWAVTSKKIKF